MGYNLGVVSEEAEMRREMTIGAAFVAALSWAGLVWLVCRTSPGPLTRPLFLALLFVALMSTFIPIALHFVGHGLRAIRRSGWAALFITLCAWLRMIRALNCVVALLLLGVFGLFEAFILTRE